MAPTIQVSVQVAILFCLVTTSMGGMKDWQKAFSQLENKMNQMRVQFEKRLKSLEGKGEMVQFKYNLQSHVKHVHLHHYGFHQSANFDRVLSKLHFNVKIFFITLNIA